MERFYRSNFVKVPDDFHKKDIEMQIIEWWAQDEEDDEADDGSEDINSQDEKNKEVYTIRCFGVSNL